MTIEKLPAVPLPRTVREDSWWVKSTVCVNNVDLHVDFYTANGNGVPSRLVEVRRYTR